MNVIFSKADGNARSYARTRRQQAARRKTCKLTKLIIAYRKPVNTFFPKFELSKISYEYQNNEQTK